MRWNIPGHLLLPLPAPTPQQIPTSPVPFSRPLVPSEFLLWHPRWSPIHRLSVDVKVNKPDLHGSAAISADRQTGSRVNRTLPLGSRSPKRLDATNGSLWSFVSPLRHEHSSCAIFRDSSRALAVALYWGQFASLRARWMKAIEKA